ncbi:MAG: carboxypeptidase regulatory-like domain-containing protein, partial [Planctomycetes bacterium]|nr:carboxypeptidase regulatory-like domain-containing protein [Planctomycetota bacterium]
EGLVLRDDVPAVGVTVYAGRPRQTFTAVTGPDGRYVIRGIAPGRYRVKARDSTMPFVSHPDAVEVTSGATTEVATFELEAGRRVTGFVVDQADRPIAGALVFVPASLSTAYTDDAGRFEIDVAPDVEELQVWSADQRVHVTERIGRRQMEIRLDTVPRRTVRARVIGLPSRRPITRAVLRVTADRSDPTWEQALSDQRDIPSMAVEMVNGSLVADLPIGKSRIEISCQGFAPFVTEVDLESDQSQPFDLGSVLLEPGAKVRGRVVGATGQPIPGAAVWLGREVDRFQSKFRVQVRTDSDGRFELGGVSPRNRDLIVASEGMSTALYQIRIPADLIDDAPFTVEMQPASLIEVQVFDAAGQPTENGVVRLQKDGTTMAFAYPDTTGRARFMAPSAGEYVLELFGEGVQGSLFVGQRPERYELTLRSEQ